MVTRAPHAAPTLPAALEAAAVLAYRGDADTYAVTPSRRRVLGVRPRPGVSRAVDVLAVLECRCDLRGGPHGLPVGVTVTVPVSHLAPLEAGDRAHLERVAEVSR